MNLTWLEDFLALAETGNFQRAAIRRNVTQPAFSRRIQSLEDWIGVQLFDRHAQPVVMTAAGRRLEPAVGEILHRMLLAREDARAAADPGPALLRIAATHVLSFSFLPLWLRRLESVRVQPAVHLVSNSLAACEQSMLQGEVQFLLCHHHPAAPGRLEGAEFRSLQVGEDMLSPVCAPGVTGGTAPFLAYSGESGLGRIVAARREHGAEPATEPVFTSHLAAALRTMARDGRGVAWLPLSLVAGDLADGSLVRADGQGRDIALGIRLFRAAAPQSAAAVDFWALAGGCQGPVG